MMRKTMILALAALGATAAAAQTPGQSAVPVKPAKDPNKMICEREEETGSRLAARKVCLTREQWEMRRRDHRNELERAQQNSTFPKSG